jgi:hypothetical protein
LKLSGFTDVAGEIEDQNAGYTLKLKQSDLASAGYGGRGRRALEVGSTLAENIFFDELTEQRSRWR